jgi:hypothetical protein
MTTIMLLLVRSSSSRLLSLEVLVLWYHMTMIVLLVVRSSSSCQLSHEVIVLCLSYDHDCVIVGKK